ncbi:MAG TPA: choice-of-anchor tandem repeat GloVer-containing protein [Silvibacterium sp.]|nr:choice-of-anchor tandem repeat GloVer-containing protein [Silvibacterium sp.]
MKSRTWMWTTALCLFATLAIPFRLAAQDSPALTPATPSDQAPSYKALYTFTGGADGGNPNLLGSGASLIRDREGNFYGTTLYGGDLSGCGGQGCGVVFKVDLAGNESVLHAFAGSPDASSPSAGLIRDEEGNLYGTGSGGGTAPAGGAGAVYKVDRAGNESLLYSFTGAPDGAGPIGGVIRDREGNLYGTTSSGGYLGNGCTNGCGTVFKIDRTGKETILHSFTGSRSGGPDGVYPETSLVRDEEGNLYGTTSFGGAYGSGVVFKLDSAGKESVLYSFTGGVDGGFPLGLVRASDGTLYGAAWQGGSGDCFGGGCGVVFKLDPQGKFAVFYSFAGLTDGWAPYGTPLLFRGELYGTTFFGGSTCAFCGLVYKLDANGNETVLYNFTSADGINPYAGLLPDVRGNFYGTTSYGGDLASPAAPCNGIGCGVVFKLTLHEDCKDSEKGSEIPPAKID